MYKDKHMTSRYQTHDKQILDDRLLARGHFDKLDKNRCGFRV